MFDKQLYETESQYLKNPGVVTKEMIGPLALEIIKANYDLKNTSSKELLDLLYTQIKNLQKTFEDNFY